MRPPGTLDAPARPPVPGLRVAWVFRLGYPARRRVLQGAGEGFSVNAGVRGWAIVLSCAGLCAAWQDPKHEPTGYQKPDPGAPPERLRMTAAVACKSVSGYQQFTPLEDAALSKDEKLLVYFEPEHFAIQKHGEQFRAHLTGDGRVRKRGDKAVIWSKLKLLDYTAESPRSSFPVYISYRVALKGLNPGEYDLDIILHDELAGGPPAQQTLHFKVKPNATEPEPRRHDDEQPKQSSR